MKDAVVALGARETIAAHPCTDVGLYAPDTDLLAYLLQDLRSLLRSDDVGKVEVVAHEPIVWTVHGLRRRTVVCDPEGLRRLVPVCIVGFFGARRDDIDYQNIDNLEVQLLAEFRGFPGILSYSSVELANDFWANLVVHRQPDDTEIWRTSNAHENAVAVSPRLYTSIRIHNGGLRGGVMGSQAISLERTKYWDYRNDPPWQAVRELGALSTRRTRWSRTRARRGSHR